MKKCYYFPTWKQEKDVMISLDNEKLIILNDLQYETPRDIGIDYCIRDNYTNKSTPSDPIFQKYPLLLELQKILDFDVYMQYVVFEDNKLDLKLEDNKLDLKLEDFGVYELKTIASVIMSDLRGDWGCNYSERIEELILILERLLKLDQANQDEYNIYLETAKRELSAYGCYDGRVFRDCVDSQKSLYNYEGYITLTIYNYFIKIINNAGDTYSIDDVKKEIQILEILQELSKYYRGEENKFEEVRKVLKI